MLNELLKSALVLVVSFALKVVLTALGVDIDPELFNTLVAAIVAWVLAQLGVEVAKAKAPKYFK
jgi:ribosomal protein L12E/L44/L45/RPP1/RPP2